MRCSSSASIWLRSREPISSPSVSAKLTRPIPARRPQDYCTTEKGVAATPTDYESYRGEEEVRRRSPPDYPRISCERFTYGQPIGHESSLKTTSRSVAARRFLGIRPREKSQALGRVVIKQESWRSTGKASRTCGNTRTRWLFGRSYANEGVTSSKVNDTLCVWAVCPCHEARQRACSPSTDWENRALRCRERERTSTSEGRESPISICDRSSGGGRATGHFPKTTSPSKNAH